MRRGAGFGTETNDKRAAAAKRTYNRDPGKRASAKANILNSTSPPKHRRGCVCSRWEIWSRHPPVLSVGLGKILDSKAASRIHIHEPTSSASRSHVPHSSTVLAAATSSNMILVCAAMPHSRSISRGRGTKLNNPKPVKHLPSLGQGRHHPRRIQYRVCVANGAALER